jgi:hypothetical protein
LRVGLVWAFLSQVLFKEQQRSCLAAVSRVVTLFGNRSRVGTSPPPRERLPLFVVLGKNPPSDDTGAYCRARSNVGPIQSPC